MAKRSFIYRNIFIYRLMMNLLYLGKYRKRFDAVISHLNQLAPGSRVLELCFGDMYIAEFCKRSGYSWAGLDINSVFVKCAQKKGFNAREADVTKLAQLPPAEICVIMGSLYHFHLHPQLILQKMIKAAKTIVISEPVSNLSASGGIVGFFAKRSANAGKGDEVFRYDKQSLVKMLEKEKSVLGYEIAGIEHHGKDLIVKLTSK